MINKSKVGILSLGCPRNLVDSENIAGRLKLKGYEIVDIDEADIGIINTCSFIDEAKRESIDAILDAVSLKRKGRLKRIIVYGCLTQRYKESLSTKLPEVDAFVGSISLNHSLDRFPITPKHYAYLKICEGCVNNCSFCIIPQIKGKIKSLDTASILRKVESFDKERVSEINIVGQDITAFGMDVSCASQLTAILEKILKQIKHIGWVRLLYLNPERITGQLLKIIKDSPRVCKYIDLPIQHINNRMLGLMNRRAKKDEILRMIERIRKTIPQAALRTSIIVGFPSETDKEFKELLNFVEDVKFERLGAFIYSREEGTRAYKFTGQITKEKKTERFNRVMSIQQKISQELNSQFLGKTIKVLVEDESDGCYLGRSQYDAPEVDGQVHIKSTNKLKTGDFINVKITDTLEYDLVGEALNEYR